MPAQLSYKLLDTKNIKHIDSTYNKYDGGTLVVLLIQRFKYDITRNKLELSCGKLSSSWSQPSKLGMVKPFNNSNIGCNNWVKLDRYSHTDIQQIDTDNPFQNLLKTNMDTDNSHKLISYGYLYTDTCTNTNTKLLSKRYRYPLKVQTSNRYQYLYQYNLIIPIISVQLIIGQTLQLSKPPGVQSGSEKVAGSDKSSSSHKAMPIAHPQHFMLLPSNLGSCILT